MSKPVPSTDGLGLKGVASKNLFKGGVPVAIYHYSVQALKRRAFPPLLC